MSAGEAAVNKGRKWLSRKLDPSATGQSQKRPGQWYEKLQRDFAKAELSKPAEQAFQATLVMVVLVALGPSAVEHFGVLAVLVLVAVVGTIALMATKRWFEAAIAMGVIWAVGVFGLALNTLTEEEVFLVPILIPLILTLAMAIFIIKPLFYIPMFAAGLLVYFSPELIGLLGGAAAFVGSGIVFLVVAFLAYKLLRKFKSIEYMEILVALLLLAYEFVIVWLGGEDGILLDNAQEVSPAFVGSTIAFMAVAFLGYGIFRRVSGIGYKKVLVALLLLACGFVIVWLGGKIGVLFVNALGIEPKYVEWTVAAGLILLLGSTIVCGMQDSLQKEPRQAKESLSEEERNERLYLARSLGDMDVLTPSRRHLREETLAAIGIPPAEVQLLKDDEAAAESYKSHGHQRQMELLREAIDEGERPAMLDNSWGLSVINSINGVTAGLLDEYRVTVEEVWRAQGPSPQEVEQALERLFVFEKTILLPGGGFYKPEVRKTGLTPRELDWLGIEADTFLNYARSEIRKDLRKAQLDDKRPDPVDGGKKPSFSPQGVAAARYDLDRIRDVYGIKPDDIV